MFSLIYFDTYIEQYIDLIDLLISSLLSVCILRKM